MSLVNVKVKYIRPKYKNLKEWMEDPDNIYIGRKGVVFIDKKRFPENNSIFANPFKIGKNGTREDVIEQYETYIRNKIESNEYFKQELCNLEGKVLGCWCHPEQCHGDVLLRLIDEYF